MKKLVSAIALLAVLITASSGSSSKEMYLAEGDRAPELSIENGMRHISLDEYKGDYVLLTFWKSSDAQSRIDCNVYSTWFAKTKPANIKHMSVNFDNEPVIFEEIVKLDKMDQQSQYNVKGNVATKIIADYNLQEGYGSVLIGPDGTIKAFNPSAHELSSL